MADLPQPLLEPLLVETAAARGAVVWFNTQYLSSSQDPDGVDVELEDRLTGRVHTVRVRYLVGADGARSKVMADAGLAVEGQMHRGGTVYAQFEGDLSKYMSHRPSVLTWIVNQDVTVG